MSLNDFEFGTELGKGAFGSVSIVKRKEDQQIYAMKRVKIINLPKKEKDNSFNEVRLLASLSHKNIIGYKEAFYDEKSSTLNIVMEYADDGDLSSKIKNMLKKHLQFEENTIWSILIQILEGLNYLHKSKVIHRDLKSANIFLTKKGIVKIGDLNVSIIAKKNLAVTQTGTPYYAAPEVWENESYNNKCDIWSVGCIVYEMASLHVPFRGTSIHQLYKNIMKGKYAEIPNIYSNDLKDIIGLILCLDPLKRPSANDLLNNEIIKNKIKEIGLSNGKLKEKAMLMKTIKIPKNISQINLQLPKKQYSREKNLEQMMENDEYETAKQTFYRPESADKITHTEKKFVFDNIEFGRNNAFNAYDYDYKKMKTLNEKQVVENLLKEKKIDNNENKDNNKSNITNLDENISLNKETEKNTDDIEFQKTLFNSSIPEFIQGTPILKNEDINKQKEEELNKDKVEKIIEKSTRKYSYEEKNVNKFSNIDYIFDETNKNKENKESKDNNESKDNIIDEKNKNEKINKIKSSIDNLVIDNNSNNLHLNPNNERFENKTIKRKEKSEIINTEPINLIKPERRFSDTKKGICFFIKKKNLNVKNIRNIYLKEKNDNNINNRIKTLDNNRPDNHPLSTANEPLPKIGKISNTINTNKKIGLKFKNKSNLNNKVISNSFLLEQDFNKNKKINLNKLIEMKNNPNINNFIFPSKRNLIPNGNQKNKKEIKLELNKLNIKSDERKKETKKSYIENNNNTKIRPQSVKFQNALKIHPLSSRPNDHFNIIKNNSSASKEKNKIIIKKINKDNKDNNIITPIIGDMKNNINVNNKENIFCQPNKGEYKLFYNHYYQNFLNLKSNENFQNKDKNSKNCGTPLFLKKFANNSRDSNSKDNEENKIKRKVIYEKINIEKKGEETKYNKGDEEVRYVGMGNHYNRYNIVLSKYPNLLKINNDYGIQNFSEVNKNKNHKDVPMIILPNKMRF